VLEHLPHFPPLAEQRPLPERTAARPVPGAVERGELLLLEGCVMPLVLGGTNRAAAASLSALGWNVRVLPQVVCCGSLQAHNGELDTARTLARTLIAAAEQAGGGEALFVTHSAGCGSHLGELAHLFEGDEGWQRRAAAFSARVRDYSQVVAGPLAEVGPQAVERAPVAWTRPATCATDSVCALNPWPPWMPSGGWIAGPWRTRESCCGSAGLYALLRPADAAAVFAPRRAAFEASGAEVLVTANPGCQLQWSAGLEGSGARVRHLAELVHEALQAHRADHAH
jgi:glycolate oxidase iron-sulfur subunit